MPMTPRERVLTALDHRQPDRTPRDFWGEHYIYRETPWGPMCEDAPGALANARNLADLEQFDWPSPNQFDYAPLDEQCRRWDDHALLYGFADIWQRPALVRGWETEVV